MGYFRKGKSQWALFAALFGLYFQILLPLAQAVKASDGEDGFSSRMIICTLYGAKLIDIVTGQEVPDEADAVTINSCPICLAYAIGATSLFSTPTIDLKAPLAAPVAVPLPQQQADADQTVRIYHSPRAPPVLA